MIDTDILIYSLKGDPNVVEHLRRTAAEPKALSIISYGELFYGARKSIRQEENLAQVHRVGELFQVVEVSRVIVETFASLKARLEAEGQRLEDFDLLIAATALVLGYRLITNNERDFSRIPGLEIENWTRPM